MGRSLRVCHMTSKGKGGTQLPSRELCVLARIMFEIIGSVLIPAGSFTSASPRGDGKVEFKKVTRVCLFAPA